MGRHDSYVMNATSAPTSYVTQTLRKILQIQTGRSQSRVYSDDRLGCGLIIVWTKAKVCKRCPTSKCVDETLQLLIPPQATGEQHRNNPYDIQWVRNSFTYDSWQAWHLKPKLPVHQLFFLIILLVGCRQGAGTDVRIIAHPFSVTAKFGRARLQDELSNYVKALRGAGVAQRISSALELIEHAFACMLAG